MNFDGDNIFQMHLVCESLIAQIGFNKVLLWKMDSESVTVPYIIFQFCVMSN